MRDIFKCVLLSIFFSLTIPSDSYANITSSEEYLKGRIPKKNHRYNTMKKALELMSERNAKIIVETGTARYGDKFFDSDGGSTIIFGDWAEKNGSIFYSVDISPTNIETARTVVGIYKNTTLVCEDSIQFLSNFNQQIDFLYLDSYDFDILDPKPSQNHHLKEIIAAYPRLTSKSVVMVDDCRLPRGGKGASIIPFLLKRGWKILVNEYQVILVKE
ncbi:MAG: class I SAM-dependent methyltransferase [Parachlamydiaceae bacterium]|nr:class I SAM-dependent methyltransferase [Parachlamydiaceae bacterium]